MNSLSLNFMIELSDGTSKELIPNENINVTLDNRMEYLDLSLEMRLHEFDKKYMQ